MDSVKGTLDAVLANPLVMAVVKLSLTLYAVRLAPRLPENVDNLLDNTLAKVIGLALIVYLADRDFQLAVILAVVYVLGVNVLSGRNPIESFSDFSTNFDSNFTGQLIEPKTMIYPGCQKFTLADIEKMFEEKQLDLQKTVMYAYRELMHKVKSKGAKETLMKIAYAIGLPYNLQFNDENAPYIATLLVYYGFNLGNSCISPHS